MCAKKCAHDIERLFPLKLAQNLQNLRLALPVQAVAAFRFEGGCAVRREFAQEPQRALLQFAWRSAAQRFYCRLDSAALAGDLFVGRAGNALLVFACPACGENQVRV